MKPASIILDLLRTYPHVGTSVKVIMETGAMFDLSENVMRVNLSRLVARGVVENVRRGQYRLTDHADPVNEFVERWRLGESRMRPWDGHSWVICYTSIEAAPKRSWALDANGFRPINDRVWMRPDNLAEADIEVSLQSLGVDDASLLATGARIDPRWHLTWRRHFNLVDLRDQYRRATLALESSLENLETLDKTVAMRETFELGGNAVHILAKDALLPEQLLHPAEREQLWRTMLLYDQKGRNIWSGKQDDSPLAVPMPQQQILEED